MRNPSHQTQSEKSATPEPATDNRDVEDMDLSDVEDDGSKIIGMSCVISRPLAPYLFCFPPINLSSAGIRKVVNFTN